MRIREVAPLTLTIDLDPTDCIALADACRQVASRDLGCDRTLLAALGAALLAGGFGAYALAEPDPPLTLPRMWRMWAPRNLDLVDPARLPQPESLIE